MKPNWRLILLSTGCVAPLSVISVWAVASSEKYLWIGAGGIMLFAIIISLTVISGLPILAVGVALMVARWHQQITRPVVLGGA
jgi:hypothetical protein